MVFNSLLNSCKFFILEFRMFCSRFLCSAMSTLDRFQIKSFKWMRYIAYNLPIKMILLFSFFLRLEQILSSYFLGIFVYLMNWLQLTVTRAVYTRSHTVTGSGCQQLIIFSQNQTLNLRNILLINIYLIIIFY